MKTILFPGQGAQFLGMGKDLFPNFPIEVNKASEILGYDLVQFCLNDPENKLNLTQYTQPVLYVVNALTFMNNKQKTMPDYLAGHSLGEYNALLAAGVFDFETGLKIVQKRGELMGKASGGTMMAVLKIKSSEIEELLKENKIKDIDLANYNTPTQTVISGPLEAINNVTKILEAKKATCIPLKVSAAFHSRYMMEAEKEFSAFIKDIKFMESGIPVIANATARPYENENVKETLAKQITSSVLWVESICYLMGRGKMEFDEIGTKKILTKMVTEIQKTEKPLIIAEKAEKKEDVKIKDEKKSKMNDNEPKGQAVHKTAKEESHEDILITADKLGNKDFKKEYNLKYAYLAGGMYRGVASTDMVIKLGKAGLMGYFGSAGLSISEIRDSIVKIQGALNNGENYGFNLVCNLDNPEMEMETVKLYLKEGIKRIEAAAFMQITPALVLYHLKGLEENANGEIEINNKIMGKISRPEVAGNFMSPAPEGIVKKLLEKGEITSKQAELAEKVPMCNSLCVEADSGGHTDQGIPTVLFPAILNLKKELMKKYNYKKTIYLGQAGGIGTPESAAVAFIMGADFILTGSINQCTQEGGISDSVKNMLQDINVQDTDYAPAGDMFEIGAKVQVLKKGVFFPARANKLFMLYSQYDSLEQIPEKIQKQLQEKYFKKSFTEIWNMTKEYFKNQNLDKEITKAESNAKHKMALVFRWYFNYSSQLAFKGQEDDLVNYQVHTGPALGAFNQWIKGTELEDWRNRHVDEIAEKIMASAAEKLNSFIADFGK
jgi:trans-AT polyketide synthase, acyltransferase and oxidoreductase domains